MRHNDNMHLMLLCKPAQALQQRTSVFSWNINSYRQKQGECLVLSTAYALDETFLLSLGGPHHILIITFDIRWCFWRLVVGIIWFRWRDYTSKIER